MNKRIIVLSTFTLVSTMLAGVFLYTTFFYFGAYRATHSLDIIVKRFNVTIPNDTQAFANTTLIIDNPSEHAFEVVYVAESLTYDTWGPDGQFILSDTIWPPFPWRIQPSSNITVTIEATVSPEKIQPTKPIFAEIKVYLRGPLIERFLLRSYEVLTS